MRTIIKLIFVIVLMVACKDVSNSKGIESVMDEVVGRNDVINEKYDALLQELGTQTPLTEAELLEAFPKHLGGLSGDSSTQPRVTSDNSVVGSFGEHAIRIRMEILDAAGQNAMGAVLPLKMLHLNKVTSEMNNTIRYSKKERNGIMTFGTDRDEDTKADFHSELRFLYNDRFYVTLEGKNMNVEALWDTFDLNALKNFKN
ncbi:hypothetical protein [Gelidibacter pelagius]|uniref:DUF4252 domain-containing protein n=1 Tax=Gelidibacter pelagius TaxID=2819985 RepID=A0ABS3STW7_9FLAO|nr:hypothetical protein [Gelidibacter pelagius]MBO3099167.1 hypothetical protein [Gelidibacter pelagius]